MSKQILMVLTSHAELGDSGHKTGFWVEEFAAPYYAFIDAGIVVTLATPLGGAAPVDPTSELADFQTAATKRYYADAVVQQKIATTEQLAQVNMSEFAGVFYPGGHGPLWDLAENPVSIALLESFLEAGKPVAAVCHATAALLNVKLASGELAVKGKAISGFTNSEEAAVELTEVVPFLLEDELIKRGANYQKGPDWQDFTVQDGLLISGQNPASSKSVADKLLLQISA
ncbi:MAG: thiJ/PfpI family protein [Osedax symbiont Rs1]|nr:MAG: thiJ/PfpI family protein [Osedax symbiont Rs1]